MSKWRSFCNRNCIFDLIDADATMLERELLDKAAFAGELMAFRHHVFGHCMDTKRDNKLLQAMWTKGAAPWTSR